MFLQGKRQQELYAKRLHRLKTNKRVVAILF